MKKLVVVADDFGITKEISEGIIEGHNSGLITSTALLTNGLYTKEAIELAKAHPKLEVGLHLSFVEGMSLTASPDLLSSNHYFPDKDCLHENWKDFLSAFFKGRIKKQNLEKELETQILFFTDHLGTIPFLNSTQHIHLFPPFHDMIIRLCHKYSIKILRIPKLSNRPDFSMRSLQFQLLKKFAKNLLKKAKNRGLKLQSADAFLGFQQGGKLDSHSLLQLIQELSSGVSEIMCHPGHYSSFLKKNIGGYKDYDWESELSALTNENIIAEVKKQNIQLSRYSEAFS